MDRNRYNLPNQRPQYRSVDGFVDPKLKRRKRTFKPTSLSKLPASAASIRSMQSSPKLARPKPSLSQQNPKSLLNTTIPGNGIHPLLKSNKSRKPKKITTLIKNKIVLRSALFILVLCLSVGGFLGFKGLNTINKVFHGNVLSDAQALFSNTKLKAEDTGRVNILLAGDSADDPNHGGAQL